jgi:hypothetical protein
VLLLEMSCKNYNSNHLLENVRLCLSGTSEYINVMNFVAMLENGEGSLGLLLYFLLEED